MKSVAQGKFWRLSPNWIWTDVDNKPAASAKDCLFQLYQISPTIVAMKCLENNKFVGDYSADGKEHALNARFEDAYQKAVQFRVEEGLSARRVFDVEYMWNRLEKTDAMPIILDKGQNFNNTNYLGDVSVSVTYAVTTTSTWSNSASFTTGFSYTIQAGIPELFDVSQTVSVESTRSTEMGAQNSETIEVTATYTVKDVEPGVGVFLAVSATRATGRIPYTYRYQDTAIDGATREPQDAADGIFEGVETIDIVITATDDKGVSKETTKVKEDVRKLPTTDDTGVSKEATKVKEDVGKLPTTDDKGVSNEVTKDKEDVQKLPTGA